MMTTSKFVAFLELFQKITEEVESEYHVRNESNNANE